jgi:hypothetical protein
MGGIFPHANKSSSYMAEYFICTPDKSAATNETSIERKESADRFVNIAFDIVKRWGKVEVRGGFTEGASVLFGLISTG